MLAGSEIVLNMVSSHDLRNVKKFMYWLSRYNLPAVN